MQFSLRCFWFICTQPIYLFIFPFIYAVILWIHVTYNMLPKVPADSFHQMMKRAHKIKEINNWMYCITDDTETLVRSQSVVSLFTVNYIFPPFLTDKKERTTRCEQNCQTEIALLLCISYLWEYFALQWIAKTLHSIIIHCQQVYSITETGILCTVNSWLSMVMGWSSNMDK